MEEGSSHNTEQEQSIRRAVPTMPVRTTLFHQQSHSAGFVLEPGGYQSQSLRAHEDPDGRLLGRAVGN